MDKHNRVNEILLHLADAAAQAADGMTDAVQNAGQAVGEKYDELKLRVEVARLQSEQDKLFANIGRTMYMLQNGEIAVDPETAENEAIDAQQTIDRLLLLADQKQQEIDATSERLSRLNGSNVCPVCAEVAPPKAAFCASCGAGLSGK